MIDGRNRQITPIKPVNKVSHGNWFGLAKTMSKDTAAKIPMPISIKQIMSTTVVDLRLVGV